MNKVTLIMKRLLRNQELKWGCSGLGEAKAPAMEADILPESCGSFLLRCGTRVRGSSSAVTLEAQLVPDLICVSHADIVSTMFPIYRRCCVVEILCKLVLGFLMREDPPLKVVPSCCSTF